MTEKNETDERVGQMTLAGNLVRGPQNVALPPQRWITRLIFGLCLLAFILRIAGSFLSGHFMAYRWYYEMARTLVDGGGYCVAPGWMCAYFPPVYPTILAGCILTGHFHASVVLVSSALGTGLVYLTWLIGRKLFGPAVGMMAAAYCAVYPYYIWHDTVVQENVTLAFMVALAVWCLLRADDSRWWALAAGTVLGLCVLTKANMLMFALAAPAWVLLARKEIDRSAFAFLGLALTLVPWLIRSEVVVGAPVTFSNGGFALWTANHRLTFDYFPEQSIDKARLPEIADLSEEDRRELIALSAPDRFSVPDLYEGILPRERLAAVSAKDPNGLREAKWFWDRGMRFIQSHPWLTLLRGVRKVGIAFSPIFSPRKDWGQQVVYFCSYFPLLIGSILGVWWSRRRWRDLGYLYLLLVTFAAGSAVFWAHTSHRMYLEPYLMILAAYPVAKFLGFADPEGTS